MRIRQICLENKSSAENTDPFVVAFGKQFRNKLHRI